MKLVLLISLLLQCAVFHAEPQPITSLTHPALPFVARQEKARSLLRLFEFVAPDLPHLVDITDESGLQILEDGFVNLKTRASQNSGKSDLLSTATDHYVTYVIARFRMVDNLDFSDEALRHFFSINPKKYPCEPGATVSEILVPKSYTDTAGTTVILTEIEQALEKDSFAKVAYEVSNRFGNPDIGNKGIVTKDQVGRIGSRYTGKSGGRRQLIQRLVKQEAPL